MSGRAITPLDKPVASGDTAHFRPVVTALADIPALALTEAQADRLRQGQPVLLTRDVPPSGALLRAEAGSRLVALVRSDGVALKPVRVFNL